jgi:hypothetical protein
MKRLSEETEAKIIEMINDGKTSKFISAKLKVSVPVISSRRLRMKLKALSLHDQKNEPLAEQIFHPAETTETAVVAQIKEELVDEIACFDMIKITNKFAEDLSNLRQEYKRTALSIISKL